MRFKEWLMSEMGTSTADVAGFSRICIPMVRRMWPTDGLARKRKQYKVPQVKEYYDRPKRVSGS